METVEEPGGEHAEQQRRHTPPPRRGSREERREATLRALAAGEQAHCAYCGRELPPLPSRGGRPTPYCAPDPQRYGTWGAKTISCAMLDEHREIWTRVYGAEQPMTHLDTQALDDRLGALAGVLDPVRAEVGALQARVRDELTAALSARQDADDKRAAAIRDAETARAEADTARSEADQARQDADTARTARAEAEALAEQARAERDRALDDRDLAQAEADTARGERQAALDQAATAQQRITDLQNTLAADRAAALDKLDAARREHEQAQHDLRAELDRHYEQRLRTQAEEFTGQLQADRAEADRRIAELTDRLTEATRAYADNLAPLHERIRTLEADLAAQRSTAETARHRLAQLHHDLAALLDDDHEPDWRARARALLEHHAPAAAPPADGGARPEGG